MKPRIVLIGAGRFGANHLRNLIELDREKKIHLEGVVDFNKKILQQISNKYGIETSSDYKKFIDITDAFNVVTPAQTHYKIVKDLLNNKKHVFVEKPLAKESHQAKELNLLARKNKMVLQVGHIFRYNSSVNFLKKRIQNSNKYPFFIHGKFLQTTKPKTDVGAIFNYLHHFDIIDNMIGEKPKKIFSISNLIDKKTKQEINANVFLKYTKVNVNLELGWIPNGKFRTLDLYSKNEYIECDLQKQVIHIFQNENKKEIKFKFKEPLMLELLDFIDCITTRGKKPLADGNIGERIVQIAETATKSILKNS